MTEALTLDGPIDAHEALTATLAGATARSMGMHVARGAPAGALTHSIFAQPFFCHLYIDCFDFK